MVFVFKLLIGLFIVIFGLFTSLMCLVPGFFFFPVFLIFSIIGTIVLRIMEGPGNDFLYMGGLFLAICAECLLVVVAAYTPYSGFKKVSDGYIPGDGIISAIVIHSLYAIIPFVLYIVVLRTFVRS